jgi:hypothetical protein
VFDFKGLWTHGIRPHLGAFAVVCILVCVFLSTPVLLVWSLVKRVPLVGGALQAAENANPLK